MKKISHTRYVVEYIAIAFLAYLTLSLIVAVIGGYGYREILCSNFQMAALLFIYVWLPIPRMFDLSEQES